jgi:DNA-binding NarL/FixJ family response regulator
VAIVNDYEIVVQGLAAMLAPFSDRVTVVDLAIGDTPHRPADIVLFDTFAGRKHALERLDQMAADHDLGRVVVYTWDLPDEFRVAVAERKVDAVVLKSASGEQLVDALERVYRGERVMAPEHAPFGGQATLTEREREVLALLARGLSNSQIADELYVSTDTVKTHVRKLFSKLDVSNRTQAALLAAREGLIPRGHDGRQAEVSTPGSGRRRPDIAP